MAQPISSPVLVGRAAELARLGSALERAAAGEPALVAEANSDVYAFRHTLMPMRWPRRRGTTGARLELWDQAPDSAARSLLDHPALLQRAADAAMLTGVTGRVVALVPLILVPSMTSREAGCGHGASPSGPAR